MPNGHGGIPWMGSPILIGIILGVVVSVTQKIDQELYVILGKFVSYFLAILFSWRLSSHFFMWGVTEYDGAYVKEEEIEVAKKKYLIATIVLSVIMVVIVNSIF